MRGGLKCLCVMVVAALACCARTGGCGAAATHQGGGHQVGRGTGPHREAAEPLEGRQVRLQTRRRKARGGRLLRVLPGEPADPSLSKESRRLDTTVTGDACQRPRRASLLRWRGMRFSLWALYSSFLLKEFRLARMSGSSLLLLLFLFVRILFLVPPPVWPMCRTSFASSWLTL